jgi:hypothetical protein
VAGRPDGGSLGTASGKIDSNRDGDSFCICWILALIFRQRVDEREALPKSVAHNSSCQSQSDHRYIMLCSESTDLFGDQNNSQKAEGNQGNSEGEGEVGHRHVECLRFLI